MTDLVIHTAVAFRPTGRQTDSDELGFLNATRRKDSQLKVIEEEEEAEAEAEAEAEKEDFLRYTKGKKKRGLVFFFFFFYCRTVEYK